MFRNPSIVKNGYTPDSIWRNRDTFLTGHDEIVDFLTKKWSVEDGYRLRKELFAFTDNKVRHVLDFLLRDSTCRVQWWARLLVDNTDLRLFVLAPEGRNWLGWQIAVQFWYEWHDKSGQWWRTYGLEDWTFAEDGRMRKRQMSGNDVKLTDEERWFKEGVDVNEVDISEKHW
jgi:nuclear transport factor 2 (NTF2) superfamily protein